MVIGFIISAIVGIAVGCVIGWIFNSVLIGIIVAVGGTLFVASGVVEGIAKANMATQDRRDAEILEELRKMNKDE